jgi:glycosyltransferase involved in cell wall biosynthesis
MRKVLLISNYVFHYRINNYNYFYKEFSKIGYEFIVLADGAQEVDFKVDFPLIVKDPNPLTYSRAISRITPDVVIVFLHLKDPIIYFVNYYCKLKSIPLIYWNFGINIRTPKATIKNLIYRHFHNISNAIILYSPNEKRYIKKRNHSKVFIAYNTLNFEGIERVNIGPKKYIQERYGIEEDFIVLFSGRITINKKLHILLETLRNNKEVAIVIVGAGIEPEMKKIIEEIDNYYYLGEIKYDKSEMSKIFNSADLFCIPGNLGLALNEAFFWGKPVLSIKDGREVNSPEIWYFENSKNGLMANDVSDLEEKILWLKRDKELYQKMSDYARYTADNKAHISKMFNGFREAVSYVLEKKKKSCIQMLDKSD